MNLLRLSFSIGLLGAALVPAHASHSEWSLSLVGVSNTGSVGIHTLSEMWSADSSPSSAYASQSFTGLDAMGNSQTMDFVGSTWAKSNYGRLKVRTDGDVKNTYFNATNPKYWDSSTNTVNPNGSPDSLVSLGFAGFTDSLAFGGTLEAGYRARYLFHIDGVNTGDGTFASLSAKIADNPYEDWFFIGAGAVSQTVATGLYEINGIIPQSIEVRLSNQVVFDTFNVTDGSNLIGRSDFSSTATLTGIEVVDANGNLVGGWTVQSESGTVYPVPEPFTAATLGVGFLALLRRRRK